VFGGISYEQVWRLKGVFAALPAETRDNVTQLQTLFSPFNGFGNYKKLFSTLISSNVPVIPFLMPHLQTVKNLLYASPTYCDEEGQKVNMVKFSALYHIASDLHLGTLNRFPFLVHTFRYFFYFDFFLISLRW
jgi:hypothetical protein